MLSVMRKNLVLFGLLALLIVVIAGSQFFSRQSVPERASHTPMTRTSSDGLARIPSGVTDVSSIDPLSRWAFIAADPLEQTYVSGYRVTFREQSAATDLRVQFPAPVADVPLPFFRDAVLLRPIRVAEYVVGDGRVSEAKVPVRSTGDVVFLRQFSFYPKQSPLVTVPNLTVAPVRVGESLTGTVAFDQNSEIVPVAARGRTEYGLLLGPEAVSVRVSLHTFDSIFGPETPARTVVANNVPVDAGSLSFTAERMVCQESGVARVDVVVHMIAPTRTYERMVSDWVAHRFQQSDWSFVEHSADQLELQFRYPVRVACSRAADV